MAPPSLKKIMELTVQCITKKEIRNIPVSPIVNFLPMEEVKNCLNVIVQKLNVISVSKFTLVCVKNMFC